MEDGPFIEEPGPPPIEADGLLATALDRDRSPPGLEAPDVPGMPLEAEPPAIPVDEITEDWKAELAFGCFSCPYVGMMNGSRRLFSFGLLLITTGEGVEHMSYCCWPCE
jgi:hypothetical protein